MCWLLVSNWKPTLCGIICLFCLVMITLIVLLLSVTLYCWTVCMNFCGCFFVVVFSAFQCVMLMYYVYVPNNKISQGICQKFNQQFAYCRQICKNLMLQSDNQQAANGKLINVTCLRTGNLLLETENAQQPIHYTTPCTLHAIRRL